MVEDGPELHRLGSGGGFHMSVWPDKPGEPGIMIRKAVGIDQVTGAGYLRVPSICLTGRAWWELAGRGNLLAEDLWGP